MAWFVAGPFLPLSQFTASPLLQRDVRCWWSERGGGERKVRAAKSALLLKMEAAGDSGREQKKTTAAAWCAHGREAPVQR